MTYRRVRACVKKKTMLHEIRGIAPGGLRMLMGFLFIVLGFGVGISQPVHFSFTAGTGNNATLGIPLSAHPTIAGVPLHAGDEIGAFTPTGMCVGAVVWDGTSNKAITVWGNNEMTPAPDGMQPGQQIGLRLWNASTGIEYADVSVAYSLGDGVYGMNTVHVVSTLHAGESGLAVELISYTGSVVDRHVALHWATASETNNYGFAVQKRPISATRQVYVDVGFVAGHGTVNLPQQYRLVDPDILEGPTEYRLCQIDLDGATHYSESIRMDQTTGVDPISPVRFELQQNFPNPFNPSTTIGYSVGTTSVVEIVIFTSLAEQVAVLVNEEQSAGQHSVVWYAEGLPSGVYFCRLAARPSSRGARPPGDPEATPFAATRRLLLVK